MVCSARSGPGSRPWPPRRPAPAALRLREPVQVPDGTRRRGKLHPPSPGGVFPGWAGHALRGGAGVVAAPTYFPMAGGAGLMGEAGPEAIMPLARGPDGKLGVAAGASPRPVSVNVTITYARPGCLPALRGAGRRHARTGGGPRPARPLTGRAPWPTTSTRCCSPSTWRCAGSGGPQRLTEIVTLASGREHRNGRWADSRRRYDAGFGIRSLDALHAVIAFFEERRGRLYGFRYRDRVDFRSGPRARRPAPSTKPSGRATGRASRSPSPRPMAAASRPIAGASPSRWRGAYAWLLRAWSFRPPPSPAMPRQAS